jgi:hypothetical protein
MRDARSGLIATSISRHTIGLKPAWIKTEGTARRLVIRRHAVSICIEVGPVAAHPTSVIKTSGERRGGLGCRNRVDWYRHHCVDVLDVGRLSHAMRPVSLVEAAVPSNVTAGTYIDDVVRDVRSRTCRDLGRGTAKLSGGAMNRKLLARHTTRRRADHECQLPFVVHGRGNKDHGASIPQREHTHGPRAWPRPYRDRERTRRSRVVELRVAHRLHGLPVVSRVHGIVELVRSRRGHARRLTMAPAGRSENPRSC